MSNTLIKRCKQFIFSKQNLPYCIFGINNKYHQILLMRIIIIKKEIDSYEPKYHQLRCSNGTVNGTCPKYTSAGTLLGSFSTGTAGDYRTHPYHPIQIRNAGIRTPNQCRKLSWVIKRQAVYDPSLSNQIIKTTSELVVCTGPGRAKYGLSP